MLTVIVSLAAIVVNATQYALAILEKIELEGSIISIDTILDATKQASATSGNSTLNLLFLLIGVCWIAGTVDAYILGRKEDAEQSSS